MKIALLSAIVALVAAATTGEARTVRSTIHIDRPSADATISYQLQARSRNELLDNEGVRNEVGLNGLGRSQDGLERVGPDPAGRNEIGRNELLDNKVGHSEIGRNEPGRNEISHNELGRNEISHNEPGRNEIDRNEIDRNEIGRNEIGRNEIGRSEQSFADAGINGVGINQVERNEPLGTDLLGNPLAVGGNQAGRSGGFINEAGGISMTGPMVSQGLDYSLIAHRDNIDYSRILLGFDIPEKVDNPRDITRCILRVPKPRRSPKQNYELIAYAASSNWNEATVTPASGVTTSGMLGSTLVQRGRSPGDIDVTQACRAAVERKVSVMLDSSGPLVVFDSRNSNKHRHFKLEMQYSHWKD
ncbi:hypothetical protein EV175_001068 [Coemansia sp. RSA 1933]|nr:hypothetical protein EV175_001068 [Coemansia sp. RSA 1933]